MKPILLFSLSLICCFFKTQAQTTYEYTQAQDVDIRFGAVTPVNDLEGSNLYVAGNYNNDLFIGEFDQSGNPVWTRKIDVADASITINQMIRDNKGQLVLAGTAINGEVGKGFILKFIPSKKKVAWYLKATTNSFFWDIAQINPGGNYIVGGQETNNGNGTGTDDVTYIVNKKTGAMNLFNNLDKNANESVEALVFDNGSNSVYTTGRYELQPGVSKFRWCLNKLDMDGNVEWSRYYIKSTSVSSRFYSEDMILDNNKLVMVGSGDDAGTNSFRHFWLVKTDLDGNELLTKKYDISGTEYDGLLAGIRKYDNGYVYYGTLHNGSSPTNIFLFNVDFDGNINWSKSYPFSTRIPTTGLYNSCSMAIVGNTIFQVGEKVGTDGNVRGVLMKVSLNTGDAGTCDEDILCSATDYASFDDFTTLSTVNCDIVFSNTVPGDIKQKILVSESCNIQGLVSEVPAIEVQNVTLDRTNNVTDNSISIYPNPSSGIINLELNVVPETMVQIHLFDLYGRMVFSSETSSDKITTINLKDVAAGIYRLVIVSDTGEIISSNPVVLK